MYQPSGLTMGGSPTMVLTPAAATTVSGVGGTYPMPLQITSDGRSYAPATSWASTVTNRLPRVMDQLPPGQRASAQHRMSTFGAALKQREQQLAEYLERELQKLIGLQRTLLNHYGSKTGDQPPPPELALFEREVAQQRADNAAQQRELKEQIIDIRKQIQNVTHRLSFFYLPHHYLLLILLLVVFV
jgi:DNA-binding transcriptional MerR regulator